MGRKLYSGLTSGVKGQTSIENFELINKLNDQIKEVDFFVGPNGKILPSKYKKWIGKSQRENL